ncbi:MAG TPA: hypothetical protein VFA07_18610 [Chthonomonadaceae bacterium]|nr:hypothetical protein [Chthonomonadaceae bacterium]
MTLQIIHNGIVHRHEDGTTTILRPGKNGGPGTEIEVPQELADSYRLATGEVVEGTTEPLEAHSDVEGDDTPAMAEPIDEASSHNEAGPEGPASRYVPTERLTEIARINGLSVEEAEERPFPRTRRSHSERTPPDRWLSLATGPDDVTGRMLDFAAPLGNGCMGVIYGPHGSGLTRTLRSVGKGIAVNAPDCVLLILLLRARSEEVTDWRRRFPQADVVVCPSVINTGTPEQTLRLTDLVLEAAQRQTEMGKDVVLLVDSLTGLWGAMLEVEEADAQRQADQSQARQRLREWVQKAGCFHGETPLGGSLGGSLTLVGTLWHQAIDEEAEEEGEVHPHLRLLEHLILESSWRIPLSNALAERRLYPAIDVKQCLSQYEETLLPSQTREPLWAARAALPRHELLVCYQRLMNALDTSSDLDSLLQRLEDMA